MLEHTLNVEYAASKPTSRKLAERLEELVEQAERYGAEVTVLPSLHSCYDAGYDNGYDKGCDDGYDDGYKSAEEDADVRRRG